MESNKKQYNKCQKARPSNRDRRRAGGGEREVGATRPTPAVSLPHGRANYLTSRRPATDNDDPTKPRKRPSRTTRCSAPSESGTRRVFKASYRFWRRRMEFRGMSPGRMSSGTSICASSRMEWSSHADGGMSNTQDDNNEDLPVCTFSKHQHLRDVTTVDWAKT
jgi:hypothetical protein